ncbi:hypothetical protein COX05_05120 [candidate division WWE3 bacterium CG22_combo_CG10-13_8_21_14_all_39_12]|uniref:Uncharacterized protein n=2 Tax=Katanobacteria TaxID=422282 RepID=A0A2M7X1G7_UNCKA|nr:MAG: hypothetical protein COX05_05120 [candidate division WWE3 bacterium CG22_combo_CG10-13_8_21_14_all_39_12]PJA40010.1 MAG: hypothetical protein CO179_03645 [candidate division WWE3 bacterium CG_4_9_14_3_um_filter_39_7]
MKHRVNYLVVQIYFSDTKLNNHRFQYMQFVEQTAKNVFILGGTGLLIEGFAQKMFEHQSKNTANFHFL